MSIDVEEKVHEMVSNKRIEGISFTKVLRLEKAREYSDYSYMRVWDEGAVVLARSNDKKLGMDERRFFIEVDLNRLLVLGEMQFKQTIYFDDLVKDNKFSDNDGKLGILTGRIGCGGWPSKVPAYAEIIEFCCYDSEKQAPCLAKLGRYKNSKWNKHEIKWEFVIDVIGMREHSIEKYGEKVIGDCMVYHFGFYLGDIL